MQNFKSYLKEEKEDNYSTIEKYVDYLHSSCYDSNYSQAFREKRAFVINGNQIEIKIGRAQLNPLCLKDGELPYSFVEYSGIFEYKEPDYWVNGLKSLKNFPRVVTELIVKSVKCDTFEGIDYASKITIGISSSIDKDITVKLKCDTFNLDFPKLKSLKKFNLTCSVFKLGTSSEFNNLLGFLKIKELKRIIWWVEKFTARESAFRIVEKYLDSKDIIACSEELIDKEYKEYAKL